MRIRSILTLLFATLMAIPVCASDVVWFDGQHPITYSLSGRTDPVVATALRMWRDDMRQVTGMEPQSSSRATISPHLQNRNSKPPCSRFHHNRSFQ